MIKYKIIAGSIFVLLILSMWYIDYHAPFTSSLLGVADAKEFATEKDALEIYNILLVLSLVTCTVFLTIYGIVCISDESIHLSKNASFGYNMLQVFLTVVKFAFTVAVYTTFIYYILAWKSWLFWIGACYLIATIIVGSNCMNDIKDDTFYTVLGIGSLIHSLQYSISCRQSTIINFKQKINNYLTNSKSERYVLNKNPANPQGIPQFSQS